jgi:hypothetical protein
MNPNNWIFFLTHNSVSVNLQYIPPVYYIFLLYTRSDSPDSLSTQVMVGSCCVFHEQPNENNEHLNFNNRILET